MAVSEVTICNSALTKIGVKRINALTDTSKAGLLCKEQYPLQRDALLKSHPWNFAIKRTALASTGTPAFGYEFEYPLPVDCLKVLNTEENSSLPGSKFVVEGRKILTDLSPLKIRYISAVTDVSQFDAEFQEALSLKLASELTYSLQQSNTLRESLQRQLGIVLRDARSSDAQEGTPEEMQEDTWLGVRL